MADPEAVYEVDFPHDLPTHVLARFTGINVDAYTNFVATILLRDFQLPVKGQRHISTALSNIPVFTATDERLQFGWGQESMMRSRYIHSQGYEHACIIIALSSTFHQSYAAEVLHAMTVIKAGPRDMIPHIKQWREMIRAGSGAFTPCDFDLVVEDFIRLDPYSIAPGLNRPDRNTLTPAKHLAKVLLALSGVTTKKTKQLILVGGPVIAWFAAIGEYFYDLKVTIMSTDGVRLHGQDINGETQLILYYSQSPELKILSELPELTAANISNHHDGDSSAMVQPLKYGGRVEWQALLSKVFGRAFHQCIEHEQSRVFHTAFGAAAAILEHESSSTQKHGRGERAEAPASYGIGLIQNITAWLPELRGGQSRMERQLRHNLQDNIESYFKQYEILRDACKCHRCQQGHTQSSSGAGYCLPLIVETIIALGRAISHLIVVSKLYPAREGVQRLYFAQLTKRNQVEQRNLQGSALFRSLYYDDGDQSGAKRLQDTIELFTGTRVRKQIPKDLAALAHQGVCVYMEGLQKSDRTTGPAHREGMVKVTSGAIFGKAKFFDRISLEPVVSEEEDEDWAWEEIQFDHWSRPLYFR